MDSNSPLTDLTKSLTYLEEAEKLGGSVLSDRHEIIELNKRLNSNREALRAIQRSSKSKHFLLIGGMYIKTDNESSENIIREDQTKIESQINILRSELKVKVNRLRDVEHEPAILGFNLKALTKEEMNGIRQVMGGYSD